MHGHGCLKLGFLHLHDNWNNEAVRQGHGLILEHSHHNHNDSRCGGDSGYGQVRLLRMGWGAGELRHLPVRRHLE
jgi:hypothetical protein